MNQKVYLGSCDLGEGIFAKSALAIGEPVFFLTGRILPMKEVLRLEDEGARTIQVGDDAYVDPGFPARFINHSCDPNCGITDDLCFTAVRKIEAGEELRFDYSTTMLERHWEMECLCRAPKCRGVIRDFDRLPSALQERYLELGIVQRFIVEYLKRNRADAA